MRTSAERPGGAAGPTGSENALRRQAEEIARANGARSPEDLAALSPEEVRQALHELRVHQIELEMQNEELRRAQVELDVARARYFDLFDLAPVGYVTVGEKGMILEANLTAATLLGVARGALVRRPISGYVAPDHTDVYYAHHRRVVEDGEPQAYDLLMKRPDGTRFWARLQMRLSTDAESAMPVIRTAISDVTADHDAAEEQRRLREQLAQAEKMESVGRLAGGIAHDFNNMLTIILGYTEMALDGVDPADPMHEDLEAVRTAAKRSAELTAQLLAYARKQVIRPRVMDLNEAVSITLRMLDRLLGERIEVVWRPDAGLWATVIDPTQVDRVLMNLCINARDSIAGSGRIEITTANVAFGDDESAAPAGHRPGEWVRLSVHDTGRGMSAEVMEHIFEPFFTTKDAAGGSGLGLATVEGIAAQNGGFVEVASRPGDGSRLSIYLPRSRRATDADDRRSPGRRAPGDYRLGAGETVLLVEDEVAVLQLVGEQLRRLGYAVLPARTPEEAVRVAETHPGSIDLILSDVVLPGAGGPGLVEKLGRLRPGAGRLLMSGYPSLVASQDAAPDERVALLSKPFTVERLAATVGNALDARPPSAVGAATDARPPADPTTGPSPADPPRTRG